MSRIYLICTDYSTVVNLLHSIANVIYASYCTDNLFSMLPSRIIREMSHGEEECGKSRKTSRIMLICYVVSLVKHEVVDRNRSASFHACCVKALNGNES